MDGGVSLLLPGDAKGGFESVWPGKSGIVVSGEAGRLGITDLNQDGLPDIVFAVRSESLHAFIYRGGRR